MDNMFNFGYSKATSDIGHHILNIINQEGDLEEDIGIKDIWEDSVKLETIKAYINMLLETS